MADPRSVLQETERECDRCDRCGRAAALAFLPEYGASFCEPCAADPQALPAPARMLREADPDA